MSYQDFTEDPEKDSFLKRYRIAIIVGVVLLLIIGAIGVLVQKYGKIPPPRKPQEIMIHLQPPPPLPPPPPPPPPPPQPPEQKFVEQPKDLKPLVKKDDVKTPDKPPGPPAAAGPPSDFGTGGAGGGGDGIGGSGGSQYGPYAAEVVATVKARLEANSKTNKANFHGLKTRIWADKMGRVIKATVSGTTGDPAVDDALKNEVLAGLQLPEPPPDGMPMPIVMMINEQRPN